MCIFSKPKAPPQVTAAPQIIAATNSPEATASADVEARLRRRRAGAAAHVLTSPTGIPATTKLGAPA